MNLTLTSDYDSTQLIPISDIEELLGFSSGWKTNTLIDLLNAGRLWAEGFTDRSFLEQTWTMTLDKFPSMNSDIAIYLPKGRYVSLVDSSNNDTITYVDEDGASQTLTEDTDFKIYSDGDTVRIYPIDSNSDIDSWPDTATDRKSVITVKWKSGYGSNASSVPGSIISGIKLAVHNLYCDEDPGDAAKMMLHYYKVGFAWQSANR